MKTDVNPEFEGDSARWCAECARWIEEPCEHENNTDEN